VREDNGQFHDVGSGHVGEVWLSSPSKAFGYFNLPDKTREDFHAKIETGVPFSVRACSHRVDQRESTDPETEWLRTGDLGFLYNVSPVLISVTGSDCTLD
jgi:acyl-CoA synthetase (AMP-forming)/AMP-acid ligase II